MTTSNNTYNGKQMLTIMDSARKAIRIRLYNLRRTWLDEEDIELCNILSALRQEREWVAREFDNYELHPVIEPAVMLARPRDWQQLLLEHPHISQGDKSKIAYTQNEDKGRRDIQTVTSVGKYLTRHFDMPDHTIRDLVARYGSAASFKFVHTTAEMIYHLHRGPGSCMVWREDKGVRCSDGVTRHPYETYDPKYGWHMAVRTEGDDTVGRALCMTRPDGHKYFVRTYAKPAHQGGYSETDNAMENWLREQGYEKHSSWDDGEKLAFHSTPNEFLAPYLDGGDKRVSIVGDSLYLVVDSDGEYACDQTGGSPTELRDDTFECEDCGDDTDEDDGYWVGRYEDSRVCSHCQDSNYRYAYSRSGDQYYIHEDDVVWVESQQEYFDVERLSDNNIVELENGEYEHIDNAVEVDCEWFHIDDERICRTEDTDEYLMKTDCWQCAESGNWYTDDCEDYTEYEGERYHDDHIPQHIADATADKDDDAEDDADTTPQATMLTMDMLWNTHMVWDYSIAMDQVTISMTYTHDGHSLHTERTFSTEFVNSVDRLEFNRTLRTQLRTALVEQAYKNSLATI